MPCYLVTDPQQVYDVVQVVVVVRSRKKAVEAAILAMTGATVDEIDGQWVKDAHEEMVVEKIDGLINLSHMGENPRRNVRCSRPPQSRSIGKNSTASTSASPRHRRSSDGSRHG